MPTFSWSDAEAYEWYVGRWSRPIAERFVAWLDLPPDLEWLDVGCGTGALAAAILATAGPRRLRGYDLSPHHVAAAREWVRDPRAEFGEADTRDLPEPGGGFDVAVSGLLLNFIREPADAVDEMKRVVRPGGWVAAYVWDYAEGMEMMRTFWDAAVDLDPAAAELDEARRFPLCRPDPLRRLFESVALGSVEVRSLEAPTRFAGFDEYWQPFLGGQGPAPGYVASLSEGQREELRTRLQQTLPRDPDGGIPLTARAWVVRGRKPQ